MDQFCFRWKSMRSFEDTGWVPSRRLNILIGPNNSGKSSLIAPLLLLKQTWDSPDPEIALSLHGELINAGSFTDLCFQHEEDRELTFSINFNEQPPNKEQRPPIGWTPPSICEMTFRQGTEPSRFPTLSRFRALDVFGRTVMDRRLGSRGYTLPGFGRLVDSILTGDQFQNTDLPVRNPQTDKLVTADLPMNFLFTSRSLSQRIFARSSTHLQEDNSQPQVHPMPSPPTVSLFTQIYLSLTSFMDHLFNAHLLGNMTYIGPLRQRPQRTYEVMQEIPFDVGHGGERTAELMYHHQSDEVRDSIDFWMQTFGLAEHIRCHSITDSIFSLVVDAGGINSNIADCGFGLSQVLPLVVSGLTSAKGALIVAEQPEIHLNPKLQSTLADLFVALARSDRNLIVETHSEHLLLRLRRLMAEGQIDPQDVAVLFVEKSGSCSSVREVVLEANGSIQNDDWPVGFFEDSMSNAIGLASAQQDRKS